MDTDTEIYRNLQQHLDKGPVGYPTTPSGIDISLLKHLFTPEEAQIAVQLSTIKLESAGRIYRRAKKSGLVTSLEQLQIILDRMAYKGTVLVYLEGYPEKRYKNAGVTAGGIVDFQVNRLTKDLVDTFHQYHVEVFARAEMTGSRGLPQLRTIPVEKSIPVPDKHLVSTYDDVRMLVGNAAGPIAVANCVCRQTKDIQGQPCTHSDIRETCLQIGTDHARQYVEMGIARYIIKEEAFNILEKAQQAGFILQPENSLRPEAICCCCGDCCGILSSVKRFPRPADYYASNFYAEIDPDLCSGCQTCIERCQMDAPFMTNGVAAINLDRCIGCGNCVAVCEANAVRLKKKESVTVPPKDTDEFHQKILAKKLGK